MSAILIPLANTLKKINEAEKPKNGFIKIYYIYSQEKVLKKAIKLIDKINIITAEMLQEFITLIQTSIIKNDKIITAYVDKDTGLYILNFQFEDDEAKLQYKIDLKTSQNNITLEIDAISKTSGIFVSKENHYIKDFIFKEGNTNNLLYKINNELVYLIKDFMKGIYYNGKSK